MPPFKPRPRLRRRRRTALQLSSCDQVWHIMHPEPDDPIVIESFADAAMLAFEAHELDIREMLVLLDERRHVTAALLNPPPEIGLFVGLYAPPGVEAPFCQTIDIVVRADVPEAPATAHDRECYHSLRRAHMAQGLLLLDVILVDGERVQSLAIACDPDPIWFDDQQPLDSGNVA